jgi:transcriptional regulator with XRE-family HTH domain
VDKSIASPDYRTFLRELRAARKRGGLTQADVARRLRETQSFISKCERGERRLDVIELRAFCSAIGVSFPEFVRHLDGTLRTAQAPRTGHRRR